MRIWELSSDANNYDNFTLYDESEWEQFLSYSFDGRSINDSWVPFKVKEIEKIKKGDKPSIFGSIPVFSSRAIEILKEFLEDYTEILPLSYNGRDYYIINVTKTIECIDYDKSEIVRFSNGRIMKFIKYAFKPEVIKDIHIFKIFDYSKGPVFVSDDFKRKVICEGLEGFKFELVWES